MKIEEIRVYYVIHVMVKFGNVLIKDIHILLSNHIMYDLVHDMITSRKLAIYIGSRTR